MTQVGELQDVAEKRRERLKALRGNEKGNNEQRKDESVNSLPKPVFRSYKPKDEQLKGLQLDQGKTTEVKEFITEQLDASHTTELIDQVVGNIDLTNLAPRKVDWDLKRDLAKKMQILDRRTQKAIAELIRERIKNDKPDISQMAKSSKLVEQQ